MLKPNVPESNVTRLEVAIKKAGILPATGTTVLEVGCQLLKLESSVGRRLGFANKGSGKKAQKTAVAISATFGNNATAVIHSAAAHLTTTSLKLRVFCLQSRIELTTQQSTVQGFFLQQR